MLKVAGSNPAARTIPQASNAGEAALPPRESVQKIQRDQFSKRLRLVADGLDRAVDPQRSKLAVITARVVNVAMQVQP